MCGVDQFDHLVLALLSEVLAPRLGGVLHRLLGRDLAGQRGDEIFAQRVVHRELAGDGDGGHRARHRAFDDRHVVGLVGLDDQRILEVGELEGIEEAARITGQQAEDPRRSRPLQPEIRRFLILALSRDAAVVAEIDGGAAHQVLAELVTRRQERSHLAAYRGFRIVEELRAVGEGAEHQRVAVGHVPVVLGPAPAEAALVRPVEAPDVLLGGLDAGIGVDERVALVVEQVLVGIVLADVAVVPGADAPEMAHHVAVAEHTLGGEELGQLVGLFPGAGRPQLPTVLVAEFLLVRRVFRQVPTVDPDLGVAVVADRAGLAAVLVRACRRIPASAFRARGRRSLRRASRSTHRAARCRWPPTDRPWPHSRRCKRHRRRSRW